MRWHNAGLTGGIAAVTAEGSRIVPSALGGRPHATGRHAGRRRHGTTALSGGHLGPGRL